MKTKLAAVALLICATGLSNAADKSTVPAKKEARKNASEPSGKSQKPTPEDIAFQVQFLDKLTADLTNCRADHLRQMSSVQGLLTLKLMVAEAEAGRSGLSAVERVNIENEVMTEHRQSPKFGQCQKDATAELQRSSGDFVKKFSEPRLREKGMEALATWMSALASISGKTFETDQNKFTVLANVLKLELSM